MKAPEAPTTSTDCQKTMSVDKPCTQTNIVDANGTGMCTAGSSNSLNSTCSDTTSCTLCSDVVKVKKRVSFGLQQTAYFSSEQVLSKEERKSVCWYSEDELNASRDEARMAIQVLHQQLQLDAAASTNSTTKKVVQTVTSAIPVSEGYGSWVLRCPGHETQIVCLRGIEKYADAAAKYSGQKHLVRSVLQQQSVSKEVVQISMVSRTLSKPFTDVARYYAVKYAEELDLSTKIEEEQEETERMQREEVATVLLLIMRQENDRKQLDRTQLLSEPRSQSASSKVSETPRGNISRKRALLTTSPFSGTRNVKPCLQTINDRVRGSKKLSCVGHYGLAEE